MLKAAKSKWFERLFAPYNRNLFRRRFDSFRVFGIENVRDRNESTPLLLFANHVSWWDGLAAFEISRKARLDAYLMMEERQLRRLQPFRLLGAFSVVREDARQALISVRYAAGLLREDPSRALWIFPQGEIRSFGRRPLEFYSGASRIAEKAGSCFAVPVAFRYEFGGEFKPDVYARIGEGRVLDLNGAAERKAATARMESWLIREMDLLREDVIDKNFGDYSVIL